MVRGKFTCQSKTVYGGTGPHNYTFTPVCSSSENKTWASATPTGKLEISISPSVTSAEFTPGKDYYLDITECEPPPGPPDPPIPPKHQPVG